MVPRNGVAVLDKDYGHCQALRLVAKHHRNAEYGNIIMAVYSYNDEWIQYMTEAWGEAPTIDFSDSPIVVDNEINKTTLVEST